jgi:predicted acylesterase/phospholipase RssA
MALWKPDVLVLGPGGVKGLKILGFLSPLEDSGLLSEVRIYGGVSIGAIISLLIIVGYTIREVVGIATNLDIFKELIEFDFKGVMPNRGFISSEPVRRKLSQLVVDKLGVVPTLHGLYLQTGRTLVTVTLNATDEESVMMSHTTHATVSCIDAVMFSMNIPFIFYQLVHQGKTYVDGALANPYPVDYFDDGQHNILGVYLRQSRTLASEGQLSVSSYWHKIVSSLMEQRRTNIINHCSDRCRHVCLETNTTDTMGATLSSDAKVAMIVEGYNQGKSLVKQIKAGTYVDPIRREIMKYSYPNP